MIKIFFVKVFTTPNSKNIIATLRIITTEKSKLNSLLHYISMKKRVIGPKYELWT